LYRLKRIDAEQPEDDDMSGKGKYGDIQEIAQGLYLLSLPMSLSLPYVHVVAAVDPQGRVTLFDTGLNSRSSRVAFDKLLPRIGGSLERVDRVFVTHYHIDHCGLTGYIKEQSGAKVYMSQVDYEALPRSAGKSFVALSGKNHGMTPQVIDAFCTSLDALLKWDSAPFAVERFLTDGDTFEVGGRTVVSLFTPGHTHGHVCFYFLEEQFLLAGDSILPHITPNLSPDPSAPSFLPLENFTRSLDRLAPLPIRTALPAHGEPFANLRERVVEIKEHHCRRQASILEAASHPQTAYALSQAIFGDALSDFDRGLAFTETYVHLIQLQQDGLIHATEKDGLWLFEKQQEA
jgi:glyoxylase-like metal-dependent hydrolase (beta-lactamase superfamily II)